MRAQIRGGRFVGTMSLGAQRDNRVDAGGAPSRQPAREERESEDAASIGAPEPALAHDIRPN